MFRKIEGLLVAWWYIASGARRRMLDEYDTPQHILSLVGHNQTPEEFRHLVKWLSANGFSFVSTDDILGGSVPLGRKAWMTFDDGWLGFKRLLPVCEEFNVPVTLFIAPHETERGQIWSNSIMGAVPQGTIKRLYGQPLEKREAYVDGILDNIGSRRRLLAPETLVRLSSHPLVTLENHTWSHLSCSHRPVEEVINEVRMASKVLSDWTGRKCRLVCFPFGHYTDEVFRAIKTEGYHPVTCDAGVMSAREIGRYRNMFRENVTAAENVCRALNSWMKVVVPDK